MSETSTISQQRIAAARATVEDAQAAMEAAIRDEITSGRATVSEIARTLGAKNRQRIYTILERADTTAPSQPDMPPVVYLRGAGMSADAWGRVQEACWARGWQTVRDRTTAWHHSRAGRTVVMCDFSIHDLDDEPVQVRTVTAKWRETTEECQVADLLPTVHLAALYHGGATWPRTPTERVAREMELRTITGGPYERPTVWVQGQVRLDEWALTALIQQVLDQA